MAREFAKAFYRSKEWKMVRENVLRRDRYLCVMCGCVGTQLEVHHKIHLSPSNIMNPNITLNENNLITLCRDCHFKVHEPDKVTGQKNKNMKLDCTERFMFDDNGYSIPEQNNQNTR